MIAVLNVNLGGRVAAASLNDEGVWYSPDEALAAALNVLFDPTEKCGPAHGAFGDKEVEAVLERWPGTAVLFRRLPDGVPGRVY